MSEIKVHCAYCNEHVEIMDPCGCLPIRFLNKADEVGAEIGMGQRWQSSYPEVRELWQMMTHDERRQLLAFHAELPLCCPSCFFMDSSEKGGNQCRNCRHAPLYAEEEQSAAVA